MIRYRAFRNTDPPGLVELWCNCPPCRARAQPMTVDLLDQKVLSKPYFDRHGLIVAERADRLVGFAHAGFGCTEDGSRSSTERGATCLLMVAPHEDRPAVAAGLLQRSEAYLTQGGASELYAGSVFPANPFYLGLYGGSRSPGILESDGETLGVFRQAGYQEVGSYLVMHRQLAGFRPPVDRRQMSLRREYQVNVQLDPPPRNWWEACTVGQTDRVRHQLISRRLPGERGAVTFWDMERLAGSWGVRAMGLVDLWIEESQRGQGLATFLVGESLRYLHSVNVAVAEAPVDAANAACQALFRKLGFQQVDRGFVLCKHV